MIGASVVDWAALWQVVWVSLAAATALTTAVSLAILGAARANSERRDGHTAAAAFYGTLALAGAAVCVAGVVLGVSVMLSK